MDRVTIGDILREPMTVDAFLDAVTAGGGIAMPEVDVALTLADCYAGLDMPLDGDRDDAPVL